MQVYILYPEAAELAGLSEVHELVPNWQSLEHVLAVRRPKTRFVTPLDRHWTQHGSFH